MNLHRRILVLAAAIAVASGVARASCEMQTKEREVVFQSGVIKLSGTLLTPATAGAHAAIVIGHGSGSSPRGPLRPFAERFACLGIAALVFDKRGSGESGGSWVDASLDDLSEDVLAAASFLRTQPDVDPRHVGIFGVSQSGWVIPRAALKQPDAFAFAVIITGGGIKPIDVERYDYAAALDQMHVSPADRRDGVALVERYFAYLKNGEDRAGLEQAITDSRSKPWFRAVDMGRVMPTEATRAKWAWVPDYDPVADIAQMRMPVLVLLGGRDRPALSVEMNRRWLTALSKNADATVVEILNADHGMVVEGTHHVGGGPQSYVPGYLNILDGWLRLHCGGDANN
jgi:pimeloyl-ACP methyl ester carboxylesterase